SGALVAVTEEADAAVTEGEVDAWVEPPPPDVDAWVEPPPTSVVEAEVDAAVEAPAPTGEETPESLVEQASHLDDGQAEPLYRRALELDPRSHYAALGIAEILLRRHD